jgi:hypothetical protein
MEYLFLVAIATVAYLGFPLLIKFSQCCGMHPNIEPVSPSDWPPNVAQTMSRNEHDLYNLGFTITGRYKMRGSITDTFTILTMLVNYKTGDKAMITAIWSCTHGIWNLGTLYAEFSTRFEDGYSFDTFNSNVLQSFQVDRKCIKTQVPEIEVPSELWALHRYVMRKHNPQGRKLVYDIQQVDAYFHRMWREGFEEQVKFGRYTLDGTIFRPTFKGAYLMGWGLMWPMVWIRKILMKSQAAAIIKEWKAANILNDSPFDETRVVVVPESLSVLS